MGNHCPNPESVEGARVGTVRVLADAVVVSPATVSACLPLRLTA